MATTKNYFTGNGSTTAFTFTFPYLNTAHIKVKRDGVVLTTTEYTLTPTSNPTTVNFNTAPTNLAQIEIYRETSLTTANNVFAAGSSVKAASLNDNQTQALYALEEQENSIEKGEIFNYANANHSAGATDPTTPSSGDTWFDTTNGRTYIYYVDVDSSQWVEANPPFDADGDRSFTQTGTGAVARTWDSKLKDVVSVKDFGVTGDGTTDDATAINAALLAATGKTLYFPAGTYLIGAVLLPKTGTTIVGDGIENTIIKASSSLPFHLISIVDGQDAVTIRDLRVDGNESNRSGDSGNNIMIMSNRNILERVSTIEAKNAGILFGEAGNTAEENTIINCIISNNNGVGLSQSNCKGTMITNNKFARNGRENLTIDSGSNRTICTSNRFFRHFGGVGNIGWDESVDSKICDNFIDNESDTTATAANRNGICVANQIAGIDPTTHRGMISNNQIVNYKNNGIWLKDTDDSGAVEDVGAFIISNNHLAKAASPESGSKDIKVGKTTFKTIIEGNNCADIDVDNELTIDSGGAITATHSHHKVDTEGDASSDDLVTINGGATGEMLILTAENDGRTIVAKDSTGNLKLNNDFSLTHSEDTLVLMKVNSTWIEISRSDNAS